MNQYLVECNANHGGAFATSVASDAMLEAAHHAMADFYHAASPEEIIFGNNMTTLTLHISRSISREWKEGEEIVVTRLDHDANVTPWVLAAQDRGVRVNWVDFDVEDGTLRLDDLHGPIDVQNLDCDFLVPSAYNLEEPHVTQARMELMQAKQYGDLTPASSAA